MNCIACDSKLKTLGFNNKYEIEICTECGMGTTENFITPKINEYHRDVTYFREESQFTNIFEKRVNLICKIVKKGKVLDIGSSTGALLNIFKKRGFEVIGVEPSVKSSKIALSRGIKTYSRPFEKLKLPKDSFDVVVMNHTLEHVENPKIVLNKIHFILKKDGILLIDVPNFGSLSSKFYSLKWKYLLPNEHKWHFTKKSIINLLNLHNFSVLNTYAISGIWQYSSPLAEIIESLLGFKKRFFINILTLIPSFIITKLGLGTGLIVIAQKK